MPQPTHFVPDENPQYTHFVPDEGAPSPAPSTTANPRGEGTYPMWDTAGHMSAVPYSQVPQARSGGYKFDTNKMQQRGMTPQDAYVKDAEYAGNKDQPSNASLYWKGLTDPVGSGATPQGIYGGIKQVGGQAIKTMAQPLLHPIDTVKGIAKVASDVATQGTSAVGTDVVAPMAQQYAQDKQQGGNALALENLGGQLAGNIEGGRMMGAGIKAAAPKVMQAGSAIRDAAIGDPNAAALKGLRIGPASAKALSTVRSVEGARPYLQGAKSLEDVQSRIPGAKAEIWGPYQQTVDAIGGKQVVGPDGPTTVGDLENERLQISANLRALKQGGPEAVQLATQKGMNQADLLAREKSVQAALDPHLEQAGIDPKLIRQTFGNVAQVGGRVAGKSTMAETAQPYGFGRMLNLRIDRPSTWIGEPAQGVRDLAAGRPLWRGKPTDVNLREAFRTGGAKPDFRAPASSQPPFMQPPHQLEANVPGNADYGDIDVGSMSGIPHPGPQVGMAPPSRLALPSSTGAGEAQPMLRYAKPYVEPFDPHFKPVDLNEYRGQLKKYKEQ